MRASVRGIGVALMTRRWGLASLGRERGALAHAKAVLLVRDGEPQPPERHPFGEQGVRAHGHLHGAVRQGGQHGGALPLRVEPVSSAVFTSDPQKSGERGEVLAGQQLGGAP